MAFLSGITLPSGSNYDLTGTILTVVGTQTTNTALTWTADKANRKITSSAFAKYGVLVIKVISSVNIMATNITVTTTDA